MKAKLPCKPYPYSLGFRHAWFYDDVYRANYSVISPARGKKLTTKNLEDFVRFQFRTEYKKDSETWLANTSHIYYPNGSYVILFSFRDYSPDQSVITHEAIHGAHIVMDSIGWRPDTKNDEPYTYYVESLVRRIALCLGRK